MQLMLPGKMEFGQTPWDLKMETALSRMYPRIRGPYLYGMGELGDVTCGSGLVPTGNPFSPCVYPEDWAAEAANNGVTLPAPMMGGGTSSGCMSEAQIAAQLPPVQNCSVFDTECIALNQQTTNALSTLVGGGCIKPGTPISFTPNTSAAALQAFQSNTPVVNNATVGGKVDAGWTVGTPLQTYGPVTTTPPSTPLTPMSTASIPQTGAAMAAGQAATSGAGAGTGSGSGAAAPSNNMILYAALGLGALLLLTMRK